MSINSGYMYCSCRDCFEIIIGVEGDLCDDCIKEQCDPEQECQAPNAYGCNEQEMFGEILVEN